MLSGSGKDGSVAPNQKTSVSEMLGDGSGQQPVAKRALMEAYLYHPDHPWPSDDLIVIPVHPGQSSYRLDTGEPTKTPSKRELTDQEKRQTQWLRKNGGPCEKCLKSKKKVNSLNMLSFECVANCMRCSACTNKKRWNAVQWPRRKKRRDYRKTLYYPFGFAKSQLPGKCVEGLYV